mmetsp:Transcript_36628/g.71010  ORF Transcript_36628/g.71010 Transcript_36628/m.71010 type:complete len:237 (+) Transcript_36628:284-994(+)
MSRSHGCITLESDTAHDPLVAGIISDGYVLQAAIVPHGDVASLPTESAANVRLTELGEQEVQYLLRLRFGQALNLRGKHGVYEEALAPSFGMNADNGVEVRGEQILRLLVLHRRLGIVKASAGYSRGIERNSCSVDSSQAIEEAAEFRRESIVCAVGAREHRVVSNWWHLNSMKNGTQAGLRHVGVVGVPVLTEVGGSASLAHNLQNIRMRVEPLDDRMAIKLSKSFCKGNLLAWA